MRAITTMKNALSRRQFIQSSAIGMAGAAMYSLPFSLQAQPQAEGVIAPELEVNTWIDGQGNPQAPFKISDHRGKWIYLKCFQEWCPSCHSVGFPNLQKLTAAFPDDKTVVSAVIQTVFEGESINTEDALRKNQLKYDLQVPFGHDPGNIDLPQEDPNRYPKTMLSYQTRGTPWVVVISPQGRVMFSDFHIDMDKLIAFLKTQAV